MVFGSFVRFVAVVATTVLFVLAALELTTSWERITATSLTAENRNVKLSTSDEASAAVHASANGTRSSYPLAITTMADAGFSLQTNTPNTSIPPPAAIVPKYDDQNAAVPFPMGARDNNDGKESTVLSESRIIRNATADAVTDSSALILNATSLPSEQNMTLSSTDNQPINDNKDDAVAFDASTTQSSGNERVRTLRFCHALQTTPSSNRQPPTSSMPPPSDTTPIVFVNQTHAIASTGKILFNGNTMHLYPCSGDAYTNFTKGLHQLAYQQRNNWPLWGRREYPFPNGTNVLFLGNSHTRQLGFAIPCQYADRVTYSMSGEQTVVRFSNNSTVYLIANTPYVYSNSWASLLTKYELTGQSYVDNDGTNVSIPDISFQDLDAIVLGYFNQYSKPRKGETTTAFVKLMMNFSAEHQEEGIDFSRIKPPTIPDVAQEHTGPIVAVNMFASYNEGQYKRFENDMHKMQRQYNRTNIRAINGRKYIEELGLECGTDGGWEQVCHETPPGIGMRHPRDAHRCIGDNGSHPDLVAFDIMEHLYELLASTTK